MIGWIHVYPSSLFSPWHLSPLFVRQQLTSRNEWPQREKRGNRADTSFISIHSLVLTCPYLLSPVICLLITFGVTSGRDKGQGHLFSSFSRASRSLIQSMVERWWMRDREKRKGLSVPNLLNGLVMNRQEIALPSHLLTHHLLVSSWTRGSDVEVREGTCVG